MTGSPAAGVQRAAAFAPPVRGRLARVAVHCATLLVVALPAMVAGARLGDAPAPHELDLLQQALSPATAAGARSEVVTMFAQAAVGAANWPADAAARLELLGHARLAQVFGLLLLSVLVHFCVLLARGRLQALLACVCLALTAPVRCDGFVLRSETPAVVLATFAVLLLQCLAHTPRDGRERTTWSHWLRVFALALCAMSANGLAVAALPSSGEVLLVPGIVLTLAALQVFVRGLRVRVRRSLLAVPLPAINRRLLPWTAMSLSSPMVAWWLLSRFVLGSTEALQPTYGMHEVLPAAWLPRIGTAALLLLGGVVAVVRVGVRLGRAGRLGPDLVLLVACAVALAASCADPAGQDRLPAAVALAVLGSEGVRAAVVLLRGRVRARELRV